jgi:phenylalanine-4-hydroxylase
MRIWRAMKVFYEIDSDREVYFLLGLAIRDLFRITKSDHKPAIAVKKRAKAMSASRS